jgi:hypothetical protein
MTTTNTVIAQRKTFDGADVEFWSDGAITLGNRRVAAPVVARGLPRDVQLMIAGDVCLYDAAEVRRLIKAARRAQDAHARRPYAVPANDRLRLMRAYAP